MTTTSTRTPSLQHMIIAARTNKRITQHALASGLNLSQSEVSRCERGGYVSAMTTATAAKALHRILGGELAEWTACTNHARRLYEGRKALSQSVQRAAQRVTLSEAAVANAPGPLRFVVQLAQLPPEEVAEVVAFAALPRETRTLLMACSK